MRRLLLIMLWTCAAVAANPDGPVCEEGKEPGVQGMKMRLPADSVDAAKARCRAAGWDEGHVARLFQTMSMATAESLPSDCVLLKIEEGLAKGAAPAVVQAAAEQRLTCLREADAMVRAVREGRGRQHDHLLSHMCMALESGLSEEALRAALMQGEFRYGRLIHVIEAGEAMRLAGMASDDVALVMVDCLDRGLNRPEVFRISKLVIAQTRDGADYATVRAGIWSGTE